MGRFTESELRTAFGARSFAHGHAYVERVSGVETGEGRIRASVDGT
ncbi:hypothetical protein AB0M23_12710 [Streptomyces sp. NPDC052077]